MKTLVGVIAIYLVMVIVAFLVTMSPDIVTQPQSLNVRPWTEPTSQHTDYIKVVKVPQRATKSRASRDEERQPVSTDANNGFTDVQRCIRRHESHRDYNVVAYYNGVRYSGAWQFADATWEWVTGLPAPASSYSKAVQDKAFLKLWNNGAGASHWSTAEGCSSS